MTIFYSNNYDFVPFALPPLQLQRYRDRAAISPLELPTITDRYRYQALHALPVTCVTKRYMRYQALHALPSVTERYIPLQSIESVTYFIL
jgi:hypothetical protein